MAKMQRFGLISLAIFAACRGEPATAGELPGRYSLTRWRREGRSRNLP